MANPKVIIPTGIGINSHEELGYCFRTAGADVEFKLFNDIIANPSLLEDYNGLGLPGGFMMGDSLGAGQSTANRIRESKLYDKLREKLEDGKFPIYAVCNSLQLLAKLNLFPIALGTTKNDSGKHETGFWDVKVINPENNVWLKALDLYAARPEPGQDSRIFAPISHGEGRIWVDEAELAKQKDIGALVYCSGKMSEMYRSSRGDKYNPNGSTANLAGIGWKNNIVLFPHFERLHHNYQRPDRAELDPKELKKPYQPTYLMFKAAVDFMSEVRR